MSDCRNQRGSRVALAAVEQSEKMVEKKGERAGDLQPLGYKGIEILLSEDTKGCNKAKKTGVCIADVFCSTAGEKTFHWDNRIDQK